MNKAIQQPVIDPGFMFEQSSEKGGLCEVQDIVFSATGATNNQQVIPAITGKKIVVLHGTMRSTGAQTSISFKSASGGTNVCSYELPANTVTTPNVEITPKLWGAFRTNAGEGLYVDNSAVLAAISLTYIEVTV